MVPIGYRPLQIRHEQHRPLITHQYILLLLFQVFLPRPAVIIHDSSHVGYGRPADSLWRAFYQSCRQNWVPPFITNCSSHRYYKLVHIFIYYKHLSVHLLLSGDSRNVLHTNHHAGAGVSVELIQRAKGQGDGHRAGNVQHLHVSVNGGLPLSDEPRQRKSHARGENGVADYQIIRYERRL